MLSITYHFLMPNLERVSLVLDAIPLPQRHTAHNIAMALAKRVDMRTPPNSVLFSAVTDNASNVVSAAKKIVRGLEGLLDDAVEGEANDEDDDAEAEYAIGCVPHTLNLVVRDALSASAEVDALIERVRAIVACEVCDGHCTVSSC